jgi:hypothetical protein
VTVRTLKKILLSMIVVGALGSVTVHRTFAFMSEQTNMASTAASGTMQLSTTVGANTACLSINDTDPVNVPNANKSCPGLIVAALNYPGVVKTVDVAIQNTGTVDAAKLQVWMPGGCTAVNTSTVAGLTTVPVAGAGNPCAANGGVQLKIEEYSDNTKSTINNCWYPQSNSGAACTAFGDIATFPTAAPNRKLYVAYAAPYLPILAAGATRYFKISMELPPTANDNLQGRAAQFALTWHIEDGV